MKFWKCIWHSRLERFFWCEVEAVHLISDFLGQSNLKVLCETFLH